MFSVPIIPPDLRHEETIIQAAHALASLEKTIFYIFDSIDNRCKKNESKLQIINNRIKRAQERLQGLVGSKKSITIYAPSRFPGTQILREEISSTYSTKHSSGKMDHLTSENKHFYEIKSRLDQPNANNDKLVFFHVRSSPEFGAPKIATGLGPLMPDELTYVTSTLRFNTDDYVYDSVSASSTDSSKQVKLFKRGRNTLQHERPGVRGPQLAPAPHSLTHRDHKVSQAFRYTPRLGNLPDMDLPVDLPDLPTYADDIQFVAQEHQRIAPSLLIEDLPDLEELEKQQQLQISDEKNKQSVTETSKSTNSIKEQLTLNLPPPPAPVNVNPVVNCPPPPPPPPPPPTEFSNMATAVPSNDMRSDLMAAIRKAGGVERARLRPAAPINAVLNTDSVNVESSVSNTEKPKSATAGGGLMAELHNKLLLRRKGISGAIDKDGEENPTSHSSGNPLLTHLSSLIPQTKIRRQVEQDDDDDWTD